MIAYYTASILNSGTEENSAANRHKMVMAADHHRVVGELADEIERQTLRLADAYQRLHLVGSPSITGREQNNG